MSSTEHCVTHLFERADRMCGHCGNNYCEDCLVQPFPRKPPLCKACAIAAAGIRSTAGRPPTRSRKEIKALHRSQTRSAHAPNAPSQARRLRSTYEGTETTPGATVADAVPAQLAETAAPARTKRLWRAASSS